MAPRESGKPSVLSEEYVVDSSDDQNATHSIQSKEDEVQYVPETPSREGKTAKANEHPKRKTARHSSESSSSSQFGGEEDEDGPRAADLVDGSAKQVSSKATSGNGQPRKQPKTTPTFKRSIPPTPYIPPRGFVKKSATGSDSASPTTQFLTNDLAGKELWYITAPDNVSMESITPFAIRAAMRGEPILNSAGKWYCLEDGPSTQQCTLTPNFTENTYVPGKAAISRTFHLREIINPPVEDQGPEDNPAKQVYFEYQPHAELPVKPKRKQPEGLRMRYKPFGTTNTLLRESDAEISSFCIPDQTLPLRADRHKTTKTKSRENRRSATVEGDSNVMEVDPTQTSPRMQIESPKSSKILKNAPKKKVVSEATSASAEHTKKKSKKN